MSCSNPGYVETTTAVGLYVENYFIGFLSNSQKTEAEILRDS